MIAAAVASALLLAPVSPGAGAAQSPASLAASPSRVALVGSAGRTIRVSNTGREPIVVDVAPAGFALDLRGRPRIAPRTAAAAATWLSVRPRRLGLPPGQAASLTVSAAVPPRAAPGDHTALVLVTARPPRGADLAIRMQIGIVVVVRVPGTIVRRLELRGVRVRRLGAVRLLDLSVANRGNVSERLEPGRVRVLLLRRGRLVARLRPPAREVLPRTAAIDEIRYHGRLRGRLTAVVAIAPEHGRAAVRRAFRIRF